MKMNRIISKQTSCPPTSPSDCAVAQLSDWSSALQVCFPSACDTKRKRPRLIFRRSIIGNDLASCVQLRSPWLPGQRRHSVLNVF